MLIDGVDLLATDLCIVGAGPVGLALATKCAARGLSVSLVDGGDFSKRPGWQGLFGAGISPRRITPAAIALAIAASAGRPGYGAAVV